VVKKGERRANPFKERKKSNPTNCIDSAAPSSLPSLDPGEGEEEKLDKKQMEEMEG
jgi:hypothetical protein